MDDLRYDRLKGKNKTDIILKIEPKLFNTELKFCALLFLNFSSKDNAKHTLLKWNRDSISNKNRL